MIEGPLRFRVRLLRDVYTVQKKFASGSIQYVVSNERNRLHIEGYPAVTLTQKDWVPLWDRKDLVGL